MLPDPVTELALAPFAGAMGAAKYFAPRFHAVPDNLAPAAVAFGRHRVDGALEAVENMRLAIASNLECFVVVVSAVFALRHNVLGLRFRRRL